MSRQATLEVGGAQADELVGASKAVQPSDLDRQFIVEHFDLALMLHHTLRMQELRRGIGRLVTDDTLRTVQTANLQVLRRADEVFDTINADLSSEKLADVNLRMVRWVQDRRPPMGSDFSVADLRAMGDFATSPLVQLYKENMPLVPVDVPQ